MIIDLQTGLGAELPGHGGYGNGKGYIAQYCHRRRAAPAALNPIPPLSLRSEPRRALVLAARRPYITQTNSQAVVSARRPYPMRSTGRDGSPQPSALVHPDPPIPANATDSARTTGFPVI